MKNNTIKLEKLNKLYLEIDNLIDLKSTCCSIEFSCWHDNCAYFLEKYYGEGSLELKSFNKIRFTPAVNGIKQLDIDSCKTGLERAKSIFKDFIDDIWAEIESTHFENTQINTNKVFIVHGHDDGLKNQIARLLEKQGIEPIILHEQVNAGKTIIEKIEYYGNDVGAALILFTPDDEGKAKSDSELKNRARQNVVLETGYFLGHLGRDRIITIVSDDTLELPGDLQGVVYTNKSWELIIMKELKSMGFNIDMEKV